MRSPVVVMGFERTEVNESTPDPLVLSTCPLEPSAVGRVKIRLLPVAPGCSFKVLVLVAFLKIKVPLLVEEVPRIREFATVPLLAMIELAWNSELVSIFCGVERVMVPVPLVTVT